MIKELPPYHTYSEYYISFILPYEEYYHSRIEEADNAPKAYLCISNAIYYGGTYAGDCFVLWKYVHYRKLYNELCDLEKLYSVK